MGLITGLLLLPLAPVRGTIWLAERIEEQAENELYDDSAMRDRLLELEAARETGELSDEEVDAAENELLERLVAVRGFGEETHGDVQ
ncbi:MAG: gas vesicle protein GvpG [Thermoleophilaceae bacterium]